MLLEKLLLSCGSGKQLPLHVLLYVFRCWQYIKEKDRVLFIDNNFRKIVCKLNLFLESIPIVDYDAVALELEIIIIDLNRLCLTLRNRNMDVDMIFKPRLNRNMNMNGIVSPMSFSIDNCIVMPRSHFVPISKCSMWNIQQDYYACSKHVCWDNNTVPFHISSNRYIAKYYIDIIHSIARNKSKNNNKVGSRICVVEIASGHGRLAFNLASIIHRARLDKANNLNYLEVADYDITIVATDMHSESFLELLQLPWIL